MSDEDDDGPMVFRRSNKSSNQIQLSSLTKLSSTQTQSHDAKLGFAARSSIPQDSYLQNDKVILSASSSLTKFPTKSMQAPASAPRSSIPQNSYVQNDKVVSSANSSLTKFPTKSTAAPPSFAASASPVKSPVFNLKAPTPPATESKPIPKNNASVVKEERDLVSKQRSKIYTSSTMKKEMPEICAETAGDSVDSDDDKPLSVRISSGILKGSSTPVINRVLQKTELSVKEECSEDSEDEIPLSIRFLSKPSSVASASKPYDNEEKKPLASKLQQNGSIQRNMELVKSSINKRPIGDTDLSSNPTVKKMKLPMASKPIKTIQKFVKAETNVEDSDHIPIAQRMSKMNAVNGSETSSKQKATKVVSSSFKKTTKSTKVTSTLKSSRSVNVLPSSGEGQKWTTLVHNGVLFPPPYKPHGIKMLYDGKPVDLTPEQEEVATMFAVMKDSDYAMKDRFVQNFMNDWKELLGKKHFVKDFALCDFTPIYDWHQMEKEKKKQMSADEKKSLKEDKLKQDEKYMWAIVDGVKEKVGNFRVEPPGLFRGRGEHPKMGKLKKRILPSAITLNIGKTAPIPPCPIAGESWREIKHDNTVTWLAFWNDPINNKEFKYVFLAPSSSLKGQSDKDKYEKARLLKNYIDDIRAAYTKNFDSRDPAKQEIAVATYLIDKLALRAGNEKDDDEADTVGCCTLKVENVIPKPPNILKFDFLGKDSIRYENEVEVVVPVYRAIERFRKGKSQSDDIFNNMDTAKLNAHLKELMPGLTAKVFRTYNASITLDDMLHKETKDGMVTDKIVVYQQANKQVAIICNHQRSVSKSHSSQISKLNEKIDELKDIIKELDTDLARAKKGKSPLKDSDGKQKRNLTPEILEKKIEQTNMKIEKMEWNKQSKEDLKTVALSTSRISYLDPRITVAWCKRHDVPIEKLFNRSLLAKFAWALDVEPAFRF